jgi:hypothetical protein
VQLDLSRIVATSGGEFKGRHGAMPMHIDHCVKVATAIFLRRTGWLELPPFPNISMAYWMRSDALVLCAGTRWTVSLAASCVNCAVKRRVPRQRRLRTGVRPEPSGAACGAGKAGSKVTPATISPGIHAA